MSSSIELLLGAQKGWDVVNIPNDDDPDALTRALDKFNPDVVIIHQGYCGGNLNLPADLFRNLPGVRVITLSPKDNLIEIYNKQNVIVKSASDLISVIDADTFRSNGQ
ncbi:MAG: hypothetical protein PVJ21_07895 [Anaerolineales bacterium]